MRYFEDDPQILWTRVLCPHCKKPTGHDTNCEDIGEPSFIKYNKSITLPIFSEDCFFKKEQLWTADLNYPFNPLLLEDILNDNIKGLDKIIPLKSHSFQISISRLNDDKKVRKRISQIYYSFIKEMQSKELGVEQNDGIKDRGIVGIKFPNGNFYTYDSSELTPEENINQEELILDIANNYPGSELIVNKGDLK